MSNNSESTEERIGRLERVVGLQNKMLNKLGAAIIAQHGILTGLAEALDAEFETHVAPRAPLSTMN